MHTASPSRFHLSLQPTLAWTAILGLVMFSALCLLVHAGGLLRLAYPAGAFFVGIFLYQRYPILYLGFAWWVAFLTPFVRRLIDFQSGWVDPSPVLLAPFLVMMVTFMTLVKHLPRSYRQDGLPFILAMMGIGYGLLVGLIKNSPTSVVVPLLNWAAPLLFGFHLFANWKYYPAYRQNIQRVFVWGVLVTGIYGAMQYLIAPEWDRFWLVNSKSIAFGTPEPLGMRIFSTMNSPGPFATVMMAGLLLLFTSQSPVRFVASGAGYLAFLLSLVRAAWMGWAIAVLSFIPSLKPKLQMRLVITILVMSVCVIPLVNMEPFAGAISKRLQSLSDTKSDVSYNQRLEGYTESLEKALAEIPGEGLGFVLDSDSLGANDNGILTLLFNPGWFGTLPYLGGIILLLLKMFQSTAARFDTFISAARAICLGIFAQIGLGNPTLALSGVVFWSFAGMVMAAQRYYQFQQITQKTN
ncbi:O-antigen ligase domain-containing protein [Kovacikia minuta CCNUW1]|uniref:O-antigen ligase domain-containing protein n=1 Tax=Kovacikia minuta TaxID=2931930 RepID=UPI001CCB56CF|nr:O-antigen ligase domain-containing protein [Kovacikia minuta]UBF27176.1 O-antigen ligase domain-containing protein [Kovacikia minuta CCNUW1]